MKKNETSDRIVQGDFSCLAKQYANRPGYSDLVLGVIANFANAKTRPNFVVADVGAGTGKLTEHILGLSLTCKAVEPNDAMRSEGQRLVTDKLVTWSKGSAEETGLATASVDWVTMGSSFHWTKFESALTEFHRILKVGGVFTAVWNPRNIERSPLHSRIESRIREICPELKRVSSGSGEFTNDLLFRLCSTGQFKDAFFIESPHEIVMTRERYLGVWRSVNDIQAQAGPERFELIINAIEDEIGSQKQIVVPYKTRAWTCRRIG